MKKMAALNEAKNCSNCRATGKGLNYVCISSIRLLSAFAYSTDVSWTASTGKGVRLDSCAQIEKDGIFYKFKRSKMRH